APHRTSGQVPRRDRGIITAVKRTVTKGGSAMAFLTLEDLTGSVEVIVFPRTYEQVHFLLKRDSVVVVRGKIDISEQQAKILAERIVPLEEAEEVEPLAVHAAAGNGMGEAEGGAVTRPPLSEPAALSSRRGGRAEADRPVEAPPDPRALHLRVDAAQMGEEGLQRLRELLGSRRGDQPVYLHLLRGGREVILDAQGLRVSATPELRAELEGMLGPGSVWQAAG
ncbi:MAG TPA: OB-fold nucleic acid binding domain-containing protein, partial [bacterium]